VVQAGRRTPVREVAADVCGTERRLCRQNSRELTVCDRGACGAGQCECGSTDVRRDYGVQSAAEPRREAFVARGRNWDWRTGTYGPAVCEGVWRGGDGVFDLEG